MKDIEALLRNNRLWAEKIETQIPGFFEKLSKQQKPKFLWIGCSDSRVPANQITGLLPGDIFVHRNIANQVINTDMNLLCVLQYAVEVLHIKHIIVCGHYGCGGIDAVMRKETSGILDHWLENVKTTLQQRPQLTLNELCELNVIKQVDHLSNNTYILKRWKENKDLYIHGWIYSISDGLIKDLNITKKNPQCES